MKPSLRSMNGARIDRSCVAGALNRTPPLVKKISCPAGIMGETGDSGPRSELR
jgi:hypothetical protein